MRPHGERRIKEEHTLPRPRLEIAVGRDRASAEIAHNLFINILQRGWHCHLFWHGEAEAVGLPRAVIRILAQDDHLYLVEGAELEGVKDEFRRRVDSV